MNRLGCDDATFEFFVDAWQILYDRAIVADCQSEEFRRVFREWWSCGKPLRVLSFILRSANTQPRKEG
jgi:hypothetical protein